MSEETKIIKVPKLRFREFNDKGDWKLKRLEELMSDFIVPMRDKPKDLTGNVPWCRIEDFDGMYLSKSKSNQGVSVSTIKSMNLKVYPIGTLLVSCSADLGRCAITSSELITNQTFIGLVPKKEEANTVFLYYSMINSQGRLNVMSSGTTISYLSREKFEKFDLIVPKLNEQQKIADCLFSLDELITSQRQKLEVLQVHKKGLMQQLFPAESKTVPKRRFKEFEGSGEWKERTLDSICTSIASGKDKIDVDGKYVLYGSTGVIGRSNEYSYDGNYILVARVGANAGLLTRSKGKFGVTDNTLVVSLNVTENIDFVHYTLEKYGLNRLVFGSGQPLITGGQLKGINLHLPKPGEQQKIASCLSSIDVLIKAQTEKIEKLKKHKKGLKQGLFPKVDTNY